MAMLEANSVVWLPASKKPYGVKWLTAIIITEVLFAAVRLVVQDGVKLDDPITWLCGLVPFIILVVSKIFSMKSLSAEYLEVWMATLVVIVAAHLTAWAQFIEYQINLRLDEGLMRDLVCSAIYSVGGSIVSVLTIYAIHRRYYNSPNMIGSIFAVTLTLVLCVYWQPYTFSI